MANRINEPKETNPSPAEPEATVDDVSAATSEPSQPKTKTPIPANSHWQRFRLWYLSHKKLSIPLTVLGILLLLAVVPFTRYAVAGVFVQQDIEIKVLDSKTGAPVSDAAVSADSGKISRTNGSGIAKLPNMKPGNTLIKVTKKYYKDGQLNAVVPVIKPKNPFNLKLDATGRQVKIKINDLINQKALSEVEIAIADIKAKTDKSGEAIVVLPVGTKSSEATLSLDNYNEAKVTVQASDTEIKQNSFKLTPAGHIYFLSNRNGKIDVMKADLDGTAPKTVLAGTGNEDEYNTVLLASPDWKYLALLARRDDKPKVYVITTADDKMTTADEGAANFSLSGWLGSSLVYSLTRTDLSPWQTGASKLKSYNADTGKITTLDQTTGSGDATLSVYEYYGLVFLSGDTVVYAKGWANQGSAYESDYSGRQDKIAVISTTGKDYKTIYSADAVTQSLDYLPYSPNAIHISDSGSGATKYYDYSVGSQAKPIDLTQEEYYDSAYTYYMSPDSKKSAWTDSRDGKSTALIGDATGSDGKAVSGTSGYTVFGWYTNDYLLVSKEGSELSITSVSGGTPLKITDYQGATGYGILPSYYY